MFIYKCTSTRRILFAAGISSRSTGCMIRGNTFTMAAPRRYRRNSEGNSSRTLARTDIIVEPECFYHSATGSLSKSLLLFLIRFIFFLYSWAFVVGRPIVAAAYGGLPSIPLAAHHVDGPATQYNKISCTRTYNILCESNNQNTPQTMQDTMLGVYSNNNNNNNLL